jgi:rubredoxin
MSSPLATNPGFTDHTCVTVTCGTCGYIFDEDNECAFHYPNRDEAAEAVTEAGWWVLPDSVQCPRCAGRQACQHLGHAWTPWHLCRCNGLIVRHVQQMESRTCGSCDAYEARPAPDTGDAGEVAA